MLITHHALAIGAHMTAKLSAQTFVRTFTLLHRNHELDVAASSQLIFREAGELLQSDARAHDARIRVDRESDCGDILEDACEPRLGCGRRNRPGLRAAFASRFQEGF